jgi:hypothetical protein
MGMVIASEIGMRLMDRRTTREQEHYGSKKRGFGKCTFFPG